METFSAPPAHAETTEKKKIAKTKINISAFIYLASSAVLIVLAVVSLFTGFKVRFLPFKLCPILFTLSAILILLGY